MCRSYDCIGPKTSPIDWRRFCSLVTSNRWQSLPSPDIDLGVSLYDALGDLLCDDGVRRERDVVLQDKLNRGVPLWTRTRGLKRKPTYPGAARRHPKEGMF